MVEETRFQESKKEVVEMLKELKTKQESSMEELKILIKALSLQNMEVINSRAKHVEKSSETSLNLRSEVRKGENQFCQSTEVELLKFEGTGLEGWIRRIEYFFEMNQSPQESRVRMAALHLEGMVIQWHQEFINSRGNDVHMDWNEYKLALIARFGCHGFDDPLGELRNLKQTETLQQYMDKFSELYLRVDVKESQALSFFLSGLMDEIRMPVIMFKPKSVADAFSLAKLQELTMDVIQNKPLLCDPSSLPKYPPNEEFDAKMRDEEVTRQRAAGSKGQRPDIERRGTIESRAVLALDANAELVLSMQKRQGQSNSRSRSEKFNPHPEEVASGFPINPPRPSQAAESNTDNQEHHCKRASHSGPLTHHATWARAGRNQDDPPKLSSRADASFMSGVAAARESLLFEDRRGSFVVLVKKDISWRLCDVWIPWIGGKLHKVCQVLRANGKKIWKIYAYGFQRPSLRTRKLFRRGNCYGPKTTSQTLELKS